MTPDEVLAIEPDVLAAMITVRAEQIDEQEASDREARLSAGLSQSMAGGRG